MSDLPTFEDSTVQEIYRLLCDTGPCPDGGHWEGYVARHIAKLTASRQAEAEAAYQAESDLGDALADQVQILLDQRDALQVRADHFAREVGRLQQANAILRTERSGAVWVCPECDIAGCQHYRAALNPKGETP